jgi:predicted nucleotidyltransferase
MEVGLVRFSIDPEVWEKFDISIAYLFGSRAKGTAAGESDFDIAVLFKKKPADSSVHREIAFLTVALCKILLAEIDIISLNDASLLLKYEVVAHGQLLYCENEEERIRFEVSVIKEYIDEGPLRRLYTHSLHKKILQGT